MRIESYSFGRIKIGGREYTNDVIVFPDSVRDEWWRKEGHSLSLEDISEVMEADPDVIVVGTGAYGRMDVPQDTRKKVESQGIELIDKETEDACDIYNELKDKKKVVGAFHLTC